MHTEFPVHTVCELTLNQEHYMQPSIVSFCSEFSVIAKNVLLAMSANFHKAYEICVYKSLMESVGVCFQLDCCTATKDGSYSNLWHMHDLASVLRQPINQFIQY